MTYVRQTKADKYKKILIFAAASAIVIMAIIFVALGKDDFSQKKQESDISLNGERTKQVNLVRATREIEAGETADLTKFEIAAVPKELVPEGAVTDLQFLKDKRITDNLGKNEFLLKSDLIEGTAWYEDGDRLVEHSFQNGAIPATAAVGSVVDIKLFRQKAEDTVVVSKAVIVGKAENTLSFYLNSTEQEYLKEANAEGTLFLVQYLDKSQQASETTYIPSYGKQQTKHSETEFADTSMEKE